MQAKVVSCWFWAASRAVEKKKSPKPKGTLSSPQNTQPETTFCYNKLRSFYQASYILSMLWMRSKGIESKFLSILMMKFLNT
jgi:hypothetical protein